MAFSLLQWVWPQFADGFHHVGDGVRQRPRHGGGNVDHTKALSFEADFFQQKWADLRVRTEALGLEALTGNEKALQDKIARLAGELYRSEKTRLQMEKSITELIRTARELNQAGPLEKARKRAEYEVAVREASRFLGGHADQDRIQVAPNLQSGFVAAFDDDMDVAIANFGRAQDARVGMPFRILRDGRVIGRCKLIDRP